MNECQLQGSVLIGGPFVLNVVPLPIISLTGGKQIIFTARSR